MYYMYYIILYDLMHYIILYGLMYYIICIIYYMFYISWAYILYNLMCYMYNNIWHYEFYYIVWSFIFYLLYDLMHYMYNIILLIINKNEIDILCTHISISYSFVIKSSINVITSPAPCSKTIEEVNSPSQKSVV